jgi:hypothetical protein
VLLTPRAGRSAYDRAKTPNAVVSAAVPTSGEETPMIRLVLSCLALLAVPPADSRPEASDAGDATKVASAAAGAEALAKYNAMREKTPDTAAAQWKLALWCEQNGLTAEATVHFAAVVRLDPRRDAAWRKLGFKKQGNRWMTDEQIAAEAEQKKAEKEWAPRLRMWHRELHGGKKRAEAQAALDAVTDPAAIPSVYREFAGGGERDQMIAVQVLARIESPVSSKVLALLAIYGKTPEVRRRATETLRGRPSEDYLELLVGLMKDPIKYEVKPVGGPGSPGVLFVEGERFNVRRLYAPPAPPSIMPRPGDTISYDALGMPVITRPIGGAVSKEGVPGSKSLVYERDRAVQFSATQAMIEAQKGAVVAQAQLQGDVAQIEAINAVRTPFNDLVIDVAKAASGKDLGRTPKDWRTALAGEDKYGKQPSKTAQKPTLDALVPLGYQPAFAQLGFVTRVVVDS